MSEHDDKIDLSDIPEITDFSKGRKTPFTPCEYRIILKSVDGRAGSDEI